MTNAQRGEVSMTVARTNGDGSTHEKEYTLRLSMNAAAALEQKLKKPIGQLLAECTSLDFTSIRHIVWLLLQKHHKDEFKTVEQVGDFIDEAGGIGDFFDALQRLAKVNEPPDKPKGEGEDADPPTAQDSTGGRSSSTPGASA